MGIRTIRHPRRHRDRYSGALAYGTDLANPENPKSGLKLLGTLLPYSHEGHAQKHVPNLVAVLGVYAGFALALGLLLSPFIGFLVRLLR